MVNEQKQTGLKTRITNFYIWKKAAELWNETCPTSAWKQVWEDEVLESLTHTPLLVSIPSCRKTLQQLFTTKKTPESHMNRVW